MTSEPIRRRASGLCIDQGRLLCIQYRDPTHGNYFWGIPGGKIESDESPERTAARELEEETGYMVDIDRSSLWITQYQFNWDGEIRHCETHWFLGSLQSKKLPPKRVMDADYIVGRSWIHLQELPLFLNYHPPVLQAVSYMLQQGNT